jgi:hypothetical protein
MNKEVFFFFLISCGLINEQGRESEGGVSCSRTTTLLLPKVEPIENIYVSIFF